MSAAPEAAATAAAPASATAPAAEVRAASPGAAPPPYSASPEPDPLVELWHASYAGRLRRGAESARALARTYYPSVEEAEADLAARTASIARALSAMEHFQGLVCQRLVNEHSDMWRARYDYWRHVSEAVQAQLCVWRYSYPRGPAAEDVASVDGLLQYLSVA